jgi:hypothetical protein
LGTLIIELLLNKYLGKAELCLPKQVPQQKLGNQKKTIWIYRNKEES